MNSDLEKRTIGIIETQPVTVEGIKAIIGQQEGMECRWSASSLVVGLQLARQEKVDLLLIDKGFGLQAVLDALSVIGCGAMPHVVVWGTSMSEPEALKLLQAGARGILRKTADTAMLLSCFRAVAERSAWMEDCVFREADPTERVSRSDLTLRERQVLELVEQGLRNKQIAEELGIRPGTVKIHLKHIFEKTGVHGRYGLALSGLRRKGLSNGAGRGERQESEVEFSAA